MSDISRPVIHHPAPGVAVTMDARDHVGRERTDAEALRAAERRGAVEALRNLPDHIKPNMSLVAQIDARADAIEAGADW